MAQRKQPVRGYQGFDATPAAEPQASFVSALLRADTPDQIADLTLSQVGRFGCSGVRLVWNQPDLFGRASIRAMFPHAAPSIRESVLIDHAFAIGAPSNAASGGSHLFASPLKMA